MQVSYIHNFMYGSSLEFMLGFLWQVTRICQSISFTVIFTVANRYFVQMPFRFSLSLPGENVGLSDIQQHCLKSRARNNVQEIRLHWIEVDVIRTDRMSKFNYWCLQDPLNQNKMACFQFCFAQVSVRLLARVFMFYCLWAENV